MFVVILLSTLITYVIIFLGFVALAVGGVFLGKKLRDAKNAKNQAKDE